MIKKKNERLEKKKKITTWIILGLVIVEMIMIPVLYMSGITKPLPMVSFLLLPVLSAWIIYYFIRCSWQELEKRAK